ncbi:MULTISPECIES: hypothetical protein [Rhizobium/Agrobacterium group]|jgi:hypothetical protein|uniref:Uncharacterized protein n=2 Tax=Rhizobium/Agrobacterium group TaxID=227290 RepID=A0ABR5CK10_9HYPH|nr:hypothetical protein [Rhizobium nepotum]KJF65179.1 hypothetical protein RS75_24620 [Rhizobium nepotum 39/7]KJF70949.1 hypothetical protein RP75_23530 [Agrobacterium arsenijevicii]
MTNDQRSSPEGSTRRGLRIISSTAKQLADDDGSDDHYDGEPFFETREDEELASLMESLESPKNNTEK